MWIKKSSFAGLWIRIFSPSLTRLMLSSDRPGKGPYEENLGRSKRETILLSWNLGPTVNSRNRPKFQWRQDCYPLVREKKSFINSCWILEKVEIRLDPACGHS